MNKGELVNVIAQKTGFTKKVSEQILDAILDSIQEALKNGDNVQIVGFGTFEVKESIKKREKSSDW